MITFSKGDRVEFVQSYYSTKKGEQATVIELPSFGSDLIGLTTDSGDSVYCYPYRVKPVAVPVSKFKIGQRVVAKGGYAYGSHTDKPLVVLALHGAAIGVGPVGNDPELGHHKNGWFTYIEEHLEAYAPTFAVGDYVEVWGYSFDSKIKPVYEGRKGSVIDTYEYKSDCAKIQFEDGNSPVWGTFPNTALRKLERPKQLTVLEKAGLKVGDKVRWTGVNKSLSEAFKRNGGTVTGEKSCFVTVDVADKGTGLLYDVTELEKGTPTLLTRHGYKAGDKVRPTGVNPHMTAGKFTKLGGTIAEDQRGEAEFIYVTVDGVAAIYLPEEIEKGEVVPEPKFKVGDWVEVTGYSSVYNGVQGEIRRNSPWAPDRFVIKNDKMGELTFRPEHLKEAKRPVAPAFKVGDYVEVHGRGDKWDGTKGEVTKIEAPGFYQFVTVVDADGQNLQFDIAKLKHAERPAPKPKTVLDEAGVKVGDKVYWSGKNTALTTDFRENGATVKGVSVGGSYIKVESADGTTLLLYPNELTLTKPKVQSWAEKAVKGEVFVTKGAASGNVTRFLTKIEDDKWAVQYPNTKSINHWTNEDMAYYTATKV